MVGIYIMHSEGVEGVEDIEDSVVMREQFTLGGGPDLNSVTIRILEESFLIEEDECDSSRIPRKNLGGSRRGKSSPTESRGLEAGEGVAAAPFVLRASSRISLWMSSEQQLCLRIRGEYMPSPSRRLIDPTNTSVLRVPSG